MGDEKKKKPYTNLDLDTAEDMLVAAGDVEQAKAMRHMTQGWRNMFQGDFGQTFVDAFDRVVGNHIGPLAEAINGLRTDVKDAAAETARRLEKHDEEIDQLAAVVTEHAARLNALDELEAWRIKVDQQLVEDGTRMSKIEQQDRDDIRTEIKSTNAEIVSMKEMLKRYDGELRELVDRLAARGGNENGSG